MKFSLNRRLVRVGVPVCLLIGGGTLGQTTGDTRIPMSAQFLYDLLPVTSVTAVNPNGWTVEYPSPPVIAPDTSPITLSVVRAGFDGVGNVARYGDALVLTQRTRTPWAYSSSTVALTPQTVALSDYIYSSDTLAGVTNNSTERSPKPIVNWVSPDRQVVPANDIISVELQAFHRDARKNQQVATVIVSASDGIHAPVVKAVPMMTVSSSGSNDQHAVLVYKADLDVSGLADNAVIAVNAKVYPWVGSSDADYSKSSIADSASSGADRGGFSPRYFVRNTSRAASPPRAYVNCFGCAYGVGATSTLDGNSITGQWSQDDIIARTHPFADVQSAINAVNDPVRGIAAAGMPTSGFVDGAELRIGRGTYPFQTYNNVKSQGLAGLVVTRDPIVPRAQAILSFAGIALIKWYNGRSPIVSGSAIEFRDLRLRYSSDAYIRGSAAGDLLEETLNNVDIDLYSQSGVVGIQYGRTSVFGANLIGIPRTSGSFLSGSSWVRIDRLRGLRCVPSCAHMTIGAAVLTGSDLNDLSRASKISSGGIISYNNFVTNNSAAESLISGEGGGIISGLAIIQNAFDTINSPAILRISGDSDRYSVQHFVFQQNSFTGFSVRGRSNSGYDNTIGIYRANKLWSGVGNIQVQWNVKNDYFQRTYCHSGGCNDIYPEGHIASWSLYYGVGQRSEFVQFLNHPAPAADHAYWGVGNKAQDDHTAGYGAWNDPGYLLNPQGSAAAGPIIALSDMHLRATSSAINMVTTATLPFDLDGVPRGATTAAGAYAAAVGQ